MLRVSAGITRAQTCLPAQTCVLHVQPCHVQSSDCTNNVGISTNGQETTHISFEASLDEALDAIDRAFSSRRQNHDQADNIPICAQFETMFALEPSTPEVKGFLIELKAALHNHAPPCQCWSVQGQITPVCHLFTPQNKVAQFEYRSYCAFR